MLAAKTFRSAIAAAQATGIARAGAMATRGEQYCEPVTAD